MLMKKVSDFFACFPFLISDSFRRSSSSASFECSTPSDCSLPAFWFSSSCSFCSTSVGCLRTACCSPRCRPLGHSSRRSHCRSSRRLHYRSSRRSASADCEQVEFERPIDNTVARLCISSIFARLSLLFNRSLASRPGLT